MAELFHAALSKYRLQEKLILISCSPEVHMSLFNSSIHINADLRDKQHDASRVLAILQANFENDPSVNNESDDESDESDDESDESDDENDTYEAMENVRLDGRMSGPIVENIPELQIANMAFHLDARLILCLGCQDAVPTSYVRRHVCGSRALAVPRSGDTEDEDIIKAILGHPACSSLSRNDIYRDDNWKRHPAFDTEQSRPALFSAPSTARTVVVYAQREWGLITTVIALAKLAPLEARSPLKIPQHVKALVGHLWRLAERQLDSEDKIITALDELCDLLYFPEVTPHLAGDFFNSIPIAYIAMACLEDDGRFKAIVQLGPTLISPLQYALRLRGVYKLSGLSWEEMRRTSVVQFSELSWSVYSRLRRFVHIVSRSARYDPRPSFLHWLDLNKIQVHDSILDISCMAPQMQRIVNELAEQFAHSLLLGVTPPAVSEAAWNRTGTSSAARFHEFLSQLQAKGELGISFTLGVEDLQWDEKQGMRWVAQVNSFMRRLFGIIHATGGLPMRVSQRAKTKLEHIHTEYINGQQRLCLEAIGGKMAFRQVTGQMNVQRHLLPPIVSNLLRDYLELDAATIDLRYSTQLFNSFGTEFNQSTASRAVSKVLKEWLQIDIKPREYRQLATAIERHCLAPLDVEDKQGHVDVGGVIRITNVDPTCLRHADTADSKGSAPHCH
ncbi:hypothetical protein B0H14DRAFT_3456085 [Mycena olivaceomarginata]|nr:hypothetical protein B0H14DRAFT_3456085 [Mycena olivaceomarginata]